MSNLFDYISWRGDLSFEASPLCEVDNFIFCMVTYIDYNRIYNNYNPDVKLVLKDVAREFCKIYDVKTVKKMGLVIPWENIRKLIDRMGKSQRFSNVELSDFVNEIDEYKEMQFSAVTFHLNNDEMFISFRGTDDTLVGWKEDLRLSYLNEIPAQRRSVEYLECVARKYPNKKIYVGGHSKGGNLAKYSCTWVDDDILSRVFVIYNNDGPGFLPDIVSSERFARVENKVINFVPQSSLVGQIFQHRGKRVIIKSKNKGVYQHNIFGWEIHGTCAVRLEKFTRSGEINHEIFNTRINSMSIEERRNFADTFCSILDKSGVKSLRELTEAGFKSAAVMVRAYAELDKEQKQMMSAFLSKLLSATNKNKEV